MSRTTSPNVRGSTANELSIASAGQWREVKSQHSVNGCLKPNPLVCTLLFGSGMMAASIWLRS